MEVVVELGVPGASEGVGGSGGGRLIKVGGPADILSVAAGGGMRLFAKLLQYPILVLTMGLTKESRERCEGALCRRCEWVVNKKSSS